MKTLILFLELAATLVVVVSLPLNRQDLSGKYFFALPRSAPPYRDPVIEYSLGSSDPEQAYVPLEKRRARTESLFQPNPGILPCLLVECDESDECDLIPS